MENIKIRVVYIPYMRYEEGPVTNGHITAKSFREAILAMLEKVRMYADEESILEREEELGRQLDQDELMDIIASENGDGCDYIASIMNEDTHEEYLGVCPGLEEWTI